MLNKLLKDSTNKALSENISQALNRAWIASRIPHQGNMCLLKNVQSWDQTKIICIADSHRDLNNPLRAYDKLGIANGIEYAAQAMAVHGSLLTNFSNLDSINTERPKVGYLISVRGLTMHTTRLDDIEDDLVITANCMMANENNMLYEFTVSATDKCLIEGRAAVVLNADSLL